MLNSLSTYTLCLLCRAMDTLIRALNRLLMLNFFLDYNWTSRSPPLQSRSSPLATKSTPTIRSSPAPDISSPVYHDRPIRPLPKRRLRDRLPPQQTESLVFPSVPNHSQPLFGFPYAPAVAPPPVPGKTGDGQASTGAQVTGSRLDADMDKMERLRSRLKQQNTVGGGVLFDSTYQHTPTKSANLGRMPAPAESSTSSIDGDESFENTNNKKKRKIPQSGVIGIHHSSIAADFANMGLSPRGDEGHMAPDDYGSGTTAGIQSNAAIISGRARLGRSGRGSLDARRPLGNITNGTNFANSGSSRGRVSSGAGGKVGECTPCINHSIPPRFHNSTTVGRLCVGSNAPHGWTFSLGESWRLSTRLGWASGLGGYLLSRSRARLGVCCSPHPLAGGFCVWPQRRVSGSSPPVIHTLYPPSYLICIIFFIVSLLLFSHIRCIV